MIITLRIFCQVSRERFINLLDYSFDLLLWCIYRPSQLGESEVELCDAETRAKTLQVNKSCIRDSVLEVGPFKVAVSDLLATLPPSTLSAKETQKSKEEIPSFVDGWLTDTVSSTVFQFLFERFNLYIFSCYIRCASLCRSLMLHCGN